MLSPKMSCSVVQSFEASVFASVTEVTPFHWAGEWEEPRLSVYCVIVSVEIPALCEASSTTCEVTLKLWVVCFGVASSFVTHVAALVI
jgi:hypothetical protein